MDLSNDLLMQFAKVTKSEEQTKKETTVYGTAVKYNGSPYVRFDGSELLTPVITTADFEDNQRVSVLLKDHTATITGNLSAPSARNETVSEVRTNVTKVEEVIADTVRTEQLAAESARIDSLVTKTAKIDVLEADNVTINNRLTATEAIIKDLTGGSIDVENLTATFATVKSLDVERGRINALESDLGTIDTLIFGSATGTSIQTSFANSVIAQLGDAQIDSAMIKDVSASKITAGDIITNNVRVKSQDGALIISDATMQIKDSNRVRVQIGKDASNDYSINVWDASGNLMFSKGGITENAIKNAIIRNDMVSDTANISAHKLDINSLFEEINGGTNTLNSTKVYLDDKKQTLAVAFKTLDSTVTSQGKTITSQGTAISTIQGQISSKIWQQDIDTATDEMSIQYSTLSQRVDGISTTVSSVQTNLDNLEIGGRNYLLDSEPEQYANTPTRGEFLKTTFDLAPIFDEHGLDEYTVSFDGYVEMAGRVQVYSQNGSGSRYSFSEHIDMTTEWARYSVTFTPTGPDENFVESYLAFYGTYGTGVIPHVRKVKLEKGNRATDWTAAPEDADANLEGLENRVSEAETKITQTSSALELTATKTEVATAKNEAISTASSDATTKANNALSSANTNTANLLKNYSTTSAMNAAIKLSSDNITNIVSATYATKSAVSTLEQTANDLTLRLDTIEIGGENLFNDSERVRTTNRFLSIDTKVILESYIGKEIVVSFDMKIGEGGTSRAIQVYPYQNNGVSIKDAKTFTPTSEWQRFVMKTTVKDWGINNTTYTPGSIAWYDYAGENAYSVRKIKIELGNMPSDWSPSIADVFNDITNASKTATNYLNFSTTGLVVGNHTASTLGKNVLIDSEAVKVRTGSTVNAVFGSDIIELAKNNESATISMLKGAFKIYYDADNSDGGFGVYGKTSDGKERLAFQPVNENNNLTLGWGGYADKANSTNLYGHKMYLTTNEDIILNPGSGDVQMDGNVVLTNGKNLFGKRTDGIKRSLAMLNASNQMLFGYGSYTNNEGSVYYDGNDVNIRSKSDIRLTTPNETVMLQDGDGSATYSAFFRPNSNAKCTLGTNANRWYAVYASNATIQTSDIREKENVISLSELHSALFDKLRPVQYNFIDGNGRTCYGLIAQDVISAMSELGIGEHELDLVHHDLGDDKTKDTFGLAYSNLIAMLIYEVQKLKREVVWRSQNG